jgi:hypothetical protein
MTKVNWQHRVLDRNNDTNGRETAVRAHMARHGYRLMHRRNGQYWVMFAEPITLDQIEAWVQPRKRSRL